MSNLNERIQRNINALLSLDTAQEAASTLQDCAQRIASLEQQVSYAARAVEDEREICHRRLNNQALVNKQIEAQNAYLLKLVAGEISLQKPEPLVICSGHEHQLEQRIASLESALKLAQQFMEHEVECPAYTSRIEDCKCGAAEALTEIEKHLTEKHLEEK